MRVGLHMEGLNHFGSTHYKGWTSSECRSKNHSAKEALGFVISKITAKKLLQTLF